MFFSTSASVFLLLSIPRGSALGWPKAKTNGLLNPNTDTIGLPNPNTIVLPNPNTIGLCTPIFIFFVLMRVIVHRQPVHRRYAVNPLGGVGSFANTLVPHQIVYGDGHTYINGTIGLAEVSIAGHTIPHQAFINVTENVGLDECDDGICGLVGLSFDSPDWGLTHSLSEAGFGPTAGQSVLASSFDANLTKGRFFALSLSRLGDAADSAVASLAIGEYEKQYAAVHYMAKHAVFPGEARSWHVLTESVAVNGARIAWPANDTSTPAGTTRVLLDTGTMNILVPPEIRDRIYAVVPGAILARNSSIANHYWSTDSDVWVVPCNTAVGFTVSFGGEQCALHPLDLTELVTQTGPDDTEYTIFVGSITTGGGTQTARPTRCSVHRSCATSTPCIRVATRRRRLSYSSSARRAAVRMQLLADSPPELATADFIRLFDGPPAEADDSGPSGSPFGDNSSGCLTSLSRVAIAFADSTASDAMTAKYGPIILGLLGANLLFLVVLVILGVMSYVRGSRKTGPVKARYVPVKLRDEDSFRTLGMAEGRPCSNRS
ncbi:aspartic peptidase domain-containing protein [Mycena vulgaris]|nr:aspartic peptidase domain-containing protein [Mycena vulgaris]